MCVLRCFELHWWCCRDLKQLLRWLGCLNICCGPAVALASERTPFGEKKYMLQLLLKSHTWPLPNLQTALEAVRTRRAKQQLAESNNQQQPGGPMRVPSLEPEPTATRLNRPPQPPPPSSSRVSRAPSPRRLRAASPPRLSSRPPSPRLSKPSTPRLSRTPSLKELATLMPRYFFLNKSELPLRWSIFF